VIGLARLLELMHIRSQKFMEAAESNATLALEAQEAESPALSDRLTILSQNYLSMAIQTDLMVLLMADADALSIGLNLPSLPVDEEDGKIGTIH